MKIFKNTSASTKTSVELDAQTKVDLLPGAVAFTENDSLAQSDEDFLPVTQGEEVFQTEKTFTSALLLAGFTTPLELVPAPAAGKAIIVDKIILAMDYNSAAYATNTTLEFRYTNGSGTKVTADSAAMLDATADKITSVGGIEAALVATQAAAVVACVATGNPITGNSAIKIRTIYRVMSI
jgi:hypothetical protein